MDGSDHPATMDVIMAMAVEAVNVIYTPYDISAIVAAGTAIKEMTSNRRRHNRERSQNINIDGFAHSSSC
jgi:hypothetical protein